MSDTTGGKPFTPDNSPGGGGERRRVGPEDESREEQMDDDGLGLGPADADEDDAGIPIGDRENQAATEQMNPDKFQRD